MSKKKNKNKRQHHQQVYRPQPEYVEPGILTGVKEETGKMIPHLLVAIFFLFTTLLIAFPLLGVKGNIFLPDLVWPETFHISKILDGATTPGVPLTLLFAFAAKFIGAALVEKIFLLKLLFLTQYGMYFFISKRAGTLYAALAGFLYLFNPFMYERFMIGQWFVILGYTYLPFLLMLFERYLAKRTWGSLALFAIGYAIYPILSLHVAYIVIGILLVYLIVRQISEWIITKDVRSLVKISMLSLAHAAAFVATFLIINSFWLITFFAPAGTYQTIDQVDFAAYQTSTDATFGAYANVAFLYGFWHQGLLLPKDMFEFWWIPGLVFLLLAMVGLYREVRSRSMIALTSLIICVPTLILAVGFASPFSERLARFAIEHVPGFRGLRDTAKLIGVLAFIVALYAPLGALYLVRVVSGVKKYIYHLSAVLLFVLGFAGAFTFANAAIGQVTVHPYPDSWREVDERLSSDTTRNKVIVFPWRSYMIFPWAGSQMVSNPAQVYFSSPVLVATSTGNVLLSVKDESEMDDFIGILLDVPLERGVVLQSLKDEGITHIILFRASDWVRYQNALDSLTDVEVVLRRPEIILYRVK
jgi:hypothetical protein